MNPYLSGAVVDGPVALLLVQSAGRRNAATISCFSELAHHPTSLWVSIATSSYTHELVQQARQFTLAVLSDRQRQIALTCASVSGRERDKVATLPVHALPSGLFALDEALASSLCRVRESIAVDDHTVFFADILEGVMDSGASHRRHLLLSDF
jgi:flavin reductase (DIM6/NTAB) family NADH-FMN oxidoreductase RutF